MAKKTPQQQAFIIARTTFDKVWNGRKRDRSAKGLLAHSDKKKISHLYKFKYIPEGVDSIEAFEEILEQEFQKILDQVYAGALKAHVSIKYPEVEVHHVDTVSGTSTYYIAETRWYVTKT